MMVITKKKVHVLLALLLALSGLAGSAAAADRILGAEYVGRLYLTDAGNAKFPKSIDLVQTFAGDHFADLEGFAIFATIFEEGPDRCKGGRNVSGEVTARAGRGKKKKMTATAELMKVDGTRIPLGKLKVREDSDSDGQAFGVEVVNSSTAVLQDGDRILWSLRKIKGTVREGCDTRFEAGVASLEAFD